VAEGRTPCDLRGSQPTRSLPSNQEVRHFRSSPSTGQTTNTPLTPVAALEQTQGLQPESRNTQLRTALDDKPGTYLASPNRLNTQQYPLTHGGHNPADMTSKTRNTHIHSTVYPRGFRQKTELTAYLPTSGTKQYRCEGPPPPKTLPVDIQHLLGTWLVPPITKCIGRYDWKCPWCCADDVNRPHLIKECNTMPHPTAHPTNGLTFSELVYEDSNTPKLIEILTLNKVGLRGTI